MPIATLEELKHAVITGKIGAITIDTSVVERYQFGFESGVLAKLAQLANGDPTHLVLDIVLHEIRSHLVTQANLAHNQVKNALKPLGNSWGIDKTERDAALQLLFGGETGDLRTQKRLQDFLKDSSAIVLKTADYVSLADVLGRFIDLKPPFGATGTKKHEFPDAVALLAIENWAATTGTAVIAVSHDADWKRYCAESAGVFFIDDLAQALSAFQANADDAAALFINLVLNEKLPDLDETILGAIRQQSDKIEVHLDASSNWYYEAELYDLDIEAEAPLVEQVKHFDVVEFEKNTLVVKTSLTLDATAYFSVSFQAWDGIDKEYINAGSAWLQQTEQLELDVMLTVEFGEGAGHIAYVELLATRTTMDFGDIEPDWMNDPASIE
jgi:hypothetical protein